MFFRSWFIFNFVIFEVFTLQWQIYTVEIKSVPGHRRYHLPMVRLSVPIVELARNRQVPDKHRVAIDYVISSLTFLTSTMARGKYCNTYSIMYYYQFRRIRSRRFMYRYQSFCRRTQIPRYRSFEFWFESNLHLIWPTIDFSIVYCPKWSRSSVYTF